MTTFTVCVVCVNVFQLTIKSARCSVFAPLRRGSARRRRRRAGGTPQPHPCPTTLRLRSSGTSAAASTHTTTTSSRRLLALPVAGVLTLRSGIAAAAAVVAEAGTGSVAAIVAEAGTGSVAVQPSRLILCTTGASFRAVTLVASSGYRAALETACCTSLRCRTGASTPPSCLSCFPSGARSG